MDGTIGNRKGIPVGRARRMGSTGGVALGGRGTRPGAPIPLPSQAENSGRILTNERGHGLVEHAMAADPAMFDAYRRAVGWVGSVLFDASIPTCATRWIPAHPARHRPGAGRVLAPSTSRPGSPVTDAAVRVRLPVPQRAPPRRGRPPGPGSGLAMIMRRGP